jgi:catechol 2,3-dioxygenase-like lactoylglutathione lyase family enzyme
MPGASVSAARRFLHCNLNCTSVERASGFYERALDMRIVMRSGPDPTNGAMFGIEGEMTSRVWFVYDERGPRVCTSIELQEWESPPPLGAPHSEPWRVGAQALGFFARDVDAAAARVAQHGGSVVGRGATPAGVRVVSACDLDGVALDLVESEAVGEHAQLRQLRLTCANLAHSIPWYEALGFTVLRGPERTRWPAACFADPPSTGVAYTEAYHRGLYRMALSTDDAYAAHDTAVAAELTVMFGPEDVGLIGTPIDSMRILFLRDPDGFVVELVERPRSAFRDAPAGG